MPEIENDKERLLHEFDEAAREVFDETCSKANVQKFGVCGIDVDDPAQWLKVVAAAQRATAEG